MSDLRLVRPAVFLLSALIAVSMLAACSADRWARIEPGEYTLVRGIASSGAGVIETVRIDRERQTVVFALSDGSEITISFAPRARSQWPSGCPANIGSTRMEVLDLQEDQLVLGSITFDDPILVRNCPPDPIQVVLRENGVIGGSRTACPYPDKCIFFGKRK